MYVDKYFHLLLSSSPPSFSPCAQLRRIQLLRAKAAQGAQVLQDVARSDQQGLRVRGVRLSGRRRQLLDLLEFGQCIV